MRQTRAAHRRGMTLLEVMASVIILSITAVVVLPVIDAASRNYSETANVRSQTGRIRYAIDRVTRVLRQAPAGETSGTIGVARFDADTAEFSDGTGVDLVDGSLMLLDPVQDDAMLLDGVTAFELVALGSDGVTPVPGDAPETVDRYRVRLATADTELRMIVYPRVGMTR
ncbi:MAG: prepilin-type N-terminal cleavage/methylation domain-containing protein [Phycisphaeraceae bacterium]|nr:MAG: prepilin-type N-terminal cleavage/methylation domain-containing protein [Phycisphaeraceae bacterium]